MSPSLTQVLREAIAFRLQVSAQPVTAKFLAEHYGISERTVYRMVKKIPGVRGAAGMGYVYNRRWVK